MSVHLSVEHRGLDHLGWFNTYLDAKISFLGMICLNNPTTIALKLISTRISYDLKSYCLQGELGFHPPNHGWQPYTSPIDSLDCQPWTARILAAPSGGPTGGSGFSSCCSSSGAAAAVSNLEQGSASSKTAGQGPGASWQQAEDVIDREANLEVDLWGLLSRLGSAQLLAMVLKMLRVIQAPLLLYSAGESEAVLFDHQSRFSRR